MPNGNTKGRSNDDRPFVLVQNFLGSGGFENQLAARPRSQVAGASSKRKAFTTNPSPQRGGD